MYSAQELLHPISAPHPAGADLSFSPDLDAISQARKFDDPSLAQGEWVRDLKEADWPFVVERCVQLLTNSSKDLRLAVWLTEAGAEVHGLRGLGEGLLLLAGLCDQYWDQGLFPEAEDGDQERRIGNLSWILSRTPQLVRSIGLTENGDYSTVDIEEARKRANGNEEQQSRAPRLADIETAKRNNSARFATSFLEDAQFCVDALAQLESLADAKLGDDSPGFAAARDAVESMLYVIAAPSASGPATAAAAPDAALAAATSGYGTLGGATAGVAPGGHDQAARMQAPSSPGVIGSRAQAVAQLRAVADFFRRTEPHSPASYFADKAAAAGEQDLHTWLRSVVKDQASLAHIEELLGVPQQN